MLTPNLYIYSHLNKSYNDIHLVFIGWDNLFQCKQHVLFLVLLWKRCFKPRNGSTLSGVSLDNVVWSPMQKPHLIYIIFLMNAGALVVLRMVCNWSRCCNPNHQEQKSNLQTKNEQVFEGRASRHFIFLQQTRFKRQRCSVIIHVMWYKVKNKLW